jgi:hypothetical protein
MNECTLIGKMLGQEMWVEVANPNYKEEYAEFYAAKILEIFPVEYVEYVIAGAVYRVVRRYTLSAYGIDPSPDIPF